MPDRNIIISKCLAHPDGRRHRERKWDQFLPTFYWCGMVLDAFIDIRPERAGFWFLSLSPFAVVVVVVCFPSFSIVGVREGGLFKCRDLNTKV